MKVGASYAFTTDTRLASALSSLQIPFYKAKPYDHLEKDGKEWVQWNFEPESKCGSFNALTLIKAWEEPDKFIEEHEPYHPFSVAIKALHTREHLVDGIKKNNPLVVIKNHQGTWTVPKNGAFHKKLTR